MFDADQVKAWLVAKGLATAARFVATMDEAAGAVGVHPRTLATWIRQGAPGKTGEGYDVDGLMEWRKNQRYAESDPLLIGVSSPALEKYREHRAELARLEVLERKRLLIDRRQIEPTMLRFAQVIRSAVETLQRQYGPEAAKI
jgi:hypothetical protein